MGTILIIIGLILLVIGYVWLLVACFGESVLWGVGGLLCGLVALIFGVLNWADLKVPTMMYIGGTVLYMIGSAVK